MGCNKVSMTCGKGNQYAICISYEDTLPDFSTLACPNLQETTTELYTLVGDLKDAIDMSDIESDCITYPAEATLLDVLQAMQNKICSQNELITTMQSAITVLQEQVADLQTNTCP